MPATLRSCAASFVRSHARRAISAPPSCPNHVPPCWVACHPSPVMRRGWFGCCCRRTQRSTRSSGKRSNPCERRSSLGAREYYDYKAYEPLRHEFHLAPGMFYNLGGKLALSRSTWDAHQFPSRVHDEDGRITLLLLQAQIEERPDLDVATLVRSSTLRNPYTGEPMEYDSRAGTISFALSAHRLRIHQSRRTSVPSPSATRRRNARARAEAACTMRAIRLRRRLLYLTMATTRADTPEAPVAELVDATDLKSVGRKAMPVRFRPGAPLPC